MKTAAIFTANGCEEIEALTVVDLLRRAGVEIDIVSITEEKQVAGAHNITFIADTTISQMRNDYDAYIIPGGMPGTINLNESPAVRKALVEAAEAGKIVAAICAAPSVLGGLGILQEKRACCYPGFEERLLGAKVSKNPVEADGNIVTSRGMGTAIDFAGALIEKLLDKATADKVLSAIVYKQ